ncbi:sigma 54-interacting transcriptional regulator [Sorangium sp. So ce513]|uniref:sigma-54-dependent transcriptional regulator n=1 Tax=Sorangium sp. So ce513 TaxID=3133315 RepID=UPI003F5E2654
MSRILLVEDEVVIRTELRRMLARHGHDVVEAGAIAEAEADHDLRAFDLVLADVRLPGAPGTELVGRCGGAPVVLMTSYATVKAAVEAVKRGAADYLSKPFDHDELVALIEHHLAAARSGPSAPVGAAPGAAPSAPLPSTPLPSAPPPSGAAPTVPPRSSPPPTMPRSSPPPSMPRSSPPPSMARSSPPPSMARSSPPPPVPPRSARPPSVPPRTSPLPPVPPCSAPLPSAPSLSVRPPSVPPAPTTPADDELEGMVGGSAAMREVFAQARKVAPSEATLLILGESGTGKEALARTVHRLSPRRHLPFVPVYCATIPEALIEGELFGVERGALPGAHTARAGLCEAAEGGTLLLDDVAELPTRVQARLLRFLQTGEVRRVGASRARRVDVRLIATTHRDLAQRVRDGSFLSDLYFRLRVLELRLPPLRERPGDAVRIAEALLRRRAWATAQAPLALSPEARAAVAAAPWRGNVRELENTVNRAIALAERGEIELAHLGLDPTPPPPAPPADVIEVEPPTDSLEGYFRRFVLEHQVALTETEIARRLGISRKTLWERRQRLGIPRPRS